MDPEKRGESLSSSGPLRVDYEDMHCAVPRPRDILRFDGYGQKVLYSREFDDSPVEQILITSQQISINGHDLFEFKAEIVLANPNDNEDDFSWEEFVYNMTSSQVDESDEGQVIERTIFNNVLRVSEPRGNVFLIMTSDEIESTSIIIGNNLVEYSEDCRISEVTYPTAGDDTYNRYEFENFLRIFMMSIDGVAKVVDPEQKNRSFPPTSYLIKVEKEEPKKEDDRVAGISRLAIEAGNQKSKRTHLIDGKFELEDPKHKLEQMGGISAQIEDIDEIILGLKEADLFMESGINPAQAIMIYGEPGTGKTMLAHAIAHEAGARVVNVQSTDFRDKYVGDSAKRTKQFFDAVKNYKEGKLVVILDEFDSIVIDSGYGEDKSIVGIFKQEMNDFNNPNVLLVAITNNEGNLNSALVRSGRFGKKIYMKMPNEAALTDIALKTIASYGESEHNPFDGDGDAFELLELMANSEGLTAADISEVISRLVKSRKIREIKTGEEQPKLTSADLKQAVEDLRQS